MAKKITIQGCPLCGCPAHWVKGNRDTRMPDVVQCLECGLELEGDYTPQSAVEKWNFRVLSHYMQATVWNIDGEKCV